MNMVYAQQGSALGQVLPFIYHHLSTRQGLGELPLPDECGPETKPSKTLFSYLQCP